MIKKCICVKSRKICNSAAFVFLLIAGTVAHAEEFSWNDLRVPESLSASEKTNFRLGVLSSATLLCSYFELYGQLNNLATDPTAFEKGKATLIRTTRTLSPETCKQVLRESTDILTR